MNSDEWRLDVSFWMNTFYSNTQCIRKPFIKWQWQSERKEKMKRKRCPKRYFQFFSFFSHPFLLFSWYVNPSIRISSWCFEMLLVILGSKTFNLMNLMIGQMLFGAGRMERKMMQILTSNFDYINICFQRSRGGWNTLTSLRYNMERRDQKHVWYFKSGIFRMNKKPVFLNISDH